MNLPAVAFGAVAALVAQAAFRPMVRGVVKTTILTKRKIKEISAEVQEEFDDIKAEARESIDGAQTAST